MQQRHHTGVAAPARLDALVDRRRDLDVPVGFVGSGAWGSRWRAITPEPDPAGGVEPR
jgi:hypothetical protein